MKRFALHVSHDLGVHYNEEYEADSLEDDELLKRMNECNRNCLRFVIKDNWNPETPTPLCDLHQTVMGYQKPPRSLNENVELLRSKFSRH